jgi:predicted DNA-binding transcriptional regulator YafY
MPKSENQKLKLLYLRKILLDKTDEEHTLTVPEMITELSKYGMKAERKSIYDDLDTLVNYGLDISNRKTRTTDYYVSSRLFELPELKLLADAVASSKFVTEKKSNELIKKIESLCSDYQAKQLQRQVFVFNRVKTMNERIYYNVDTIHKAIAVKKQISFKYFDYDINKKKKYRNDGNLYLASPYALSWDNENYYMIGFYEKYNDISHFRVDKMESIEILSKEQFTVNKEFNLTEYLKKVFSMFGGEEQSIKLQFGNSLIGVVFDRFGKNVRINKIDDNSFSITVNVAVSNSFLGWLFQFGDKVKIVSPDSLINKFRQLTLSIQGLYP